MLPLWLDVFIKLTPAIITLVLGGIGSYIAFSQYLTASDKLRLDLFEKRLEAYEMLHKYFDYLHREADVSDEALFILRQALYKSTFLFGDDIKEFIDEIWNKAIEMRRLARELHGPRALPVGEERMQVVEQESKLLQWNFDRQQELPMRYAKYLKFGTSTAQGRLASLLFRNK